MSKAQEDLNALLKFDPLDTAERMLGRGEEGSIGLGMLLAQAHGLIKRDMLTELDDTMLSNKLDRYLRIVAELGFEEVLRLPFTGRSWGGETPPEELFLVFAHRDGLLLKFDTYQSTDVNGASVYYNWQPQPGFVERWRVTSSGHFYGYQDQDNPGVWVGDHDAREALRHKIQELRDNGRFLSRWTERPWLWLLHHMDSNTQDYDYAAINAQRIALLPAWVQEMITPEENG